MVATEAGRDALHTYELGPTIFVRIAPRLRVVSVKIDEYLLRIVDDVWKTLGYASRSEFIREAIVWYLHAIRVSSSGRTICVCPCSAKGAKPLDRLLDEVYEHDTGDRQA